MRATFPRPAVVLAALIAFARADDWPQFQGPNRDGVWNETGVMQTFPAEGLKPEWRTQAGHGLSSPVVAAGRVYLVDAEFRDGKARENVRCLDGKTGMALWTHTSDVAYPEWALDPANNSGPNATPVVRDGKIYSLGQMGDLLCLDAATGAVRWHRNLMADFGTKEFTGTTPSPLIEGSLLIVALGAAEKGACVVAFDKETGSEAWRALADPWTYSSPNVITAGGERQLIVWTPKSVVSLNPASGAVRWREEYDTTNLYGVAPAIVDTDLLLLSGLMFQLNAAKPAAAVLWPEHKSGAKAVLSTTSIPALFGGHVYSGKSNGRLVCLDARTGKQVWETDKVTGKGQGATIHITRNGGTALLFTEQGNLIRARLSASGYEEISRVHLVEPAHLFAGRKLVWPPPAYADGRIFIHNGAELVCFSIRAEPR